MREDVTVGAPEESLQTVGVSPNSVSATVNVADVSASRASPKNIGPYRIIRLLGEGGMGAVYEAEQDHPRRRIALKVIKAAWASPELLRRFEQESQALGRLHHPGIAQIYEASSADTGFGVQPFFAMELIEGEPLLDYAKEHKLNTRQRLELMIQVCEAVQHAHERGIIHRDLKPGNILVDESGQPKILDFGLARAADSDAQATRQTDMGQLLGTLAYMSPEQVLGDPTAVDTRSDVYALGIILYELLAGKKPYELSKQLHEAVRTIQQADPSALSTIHRTYRGDVETIVAKALEKDKERRYSSPAALAADIRRYLHNEPITARPASTMYQLQKFARRHKAMVTGITAVFLVLVAGLAISSYEAVRARRAEREARSEAATSKAVVSFLRNDMLSQAGASAQASRGLAPDPDIKMRTALDRAAQNIEGKFKDQPEVEAAVRQTLGETYLDLGVFPKSQSQLERSLQLYNRTLGPNDPKTIETMLELGKVFHRLSKYSDSASVYSKALETSRHALGNENPLTIRAMSGLAGAYALLGDPGKLPQAESLGLQALELSRRVFGPESPNTLNAMDELSSVYFYEPGHLQDQWALGRECYRISLKVLGKEHPDTLFRAANLSQVEDRLGNFGEAEAIEKEILEIQQRMLGPEHPVTLTTMYRLTDFYLESGNYAAAESLARQRLEIISRKEKPNFYPLNQLGEVLDKEHKYREAEAVYGQLLEVRAKEPIDRRTLNAMANLADVYKGEGKFTQAESLQRRVYETHRRLYGAQDMFTLVYMGNLGIIYGYQKQYLKGRALLDEAIHIAQTGNPDSLHEAWFYYASLEAVSGHKEKAFEYLHNSLKLSPADVVAMGTEPDLISLRHDLRFTALITEARRRAGLDNPSTG